MCVLCSSILWASIFCWTLVSLSASHLLVKTVFSDNNINREEFNIINSMVNNIYQTIIPNIDQSLAYLKEIGYLDESLNKMALEISNGNIDQAIEWMEKLR